MTERRLRAAVIACGRMARGHARGYQLEPRTELVACADVSPEALLGFGDEFSIPESARYLDYHEMLEEERPDVVSIVSHHQLHAEMTIAAARAGARAILCEKPIGLSLGEADDMIRACEESESLLVVGHQRRFSAQYVAARDLVASGDIGRVHYVEAHNHPNSSLLVDGTHTVDLVNFLLGDEPVEWVIGQIDARQHRSAWGQRIEDCAIAYLKYRSGVRCLLTMGGYRPPGSAPSDRPEPITPVFDWNYHKFVVHGETGRVEVDGDAPYQDRPIVRLVRGDRVEAVSLPWPLEGDASHRPPFAAEIEAMVDWLEGKVETHPGRAERGRAALEVLMAVYESSRRRTFIALPLAVADNPLFDLLDRGEI